MNDERTTIKLFFAWQNDVDQSKTTSAIRSALRIMSNRLEDQFPVQFVLDEATRDVPGAPYIPFEIARKIQAADIFVSDITTVYRFPDGGKSLPNSNVVFETGIAAALLGWNRIILLFNTQVAELENLPFDFDRHRISKYSLVEEAKKLEGKIEPLAALLVEACKLIISDRPRKPRELEGKTTDEIKKSRDIENMTWFFRQFSVPMLGNHFEEAPELLHYYAPYMYEGMKGVFQRVDFKLYDQKVYEIIRLLLENINKTLSYDHLYRDLNNNFVQAFGRRDQYCDIEQEMIAAKEIGEAAAAGRMYLSELVDYIRNEYIEIDLDLTSAHAASQYRKAISPAFDD